MNKQSLAVLAAGYLLAFEAMAINILDVVPNPIEQAKELERQGEKVLHGQAPDPGALLGASIADPECRSDLCKAGYKVIEATKPLGEGQGIIIQIEGDTLATVRKTGGDIVRTLEKANGDVVRTIVKANKDSASTFVKAGKDATATYVKAWSDTAEQSKRDLRETSDAVTAAYNFSIRELKAQGTIQQNAAKRAREGKAVDAIWGLAVERAQSTDANFAKATQESKVLNAAAASAAAIYGGPAGAAAYAAWSTYHATGDVNLALRAGILAAAQSYTSAGVSTLPTGTAYEVLQKSVVAGAVGGIAVAAAGGDEKAITDGFLKSGGAVLIQAGNDAAERYSPEARDALDTVYCISARDVDCISKTTWVKDAEHHILTDNEGNPLIDTTKLDPKENIGKWTGIDVNSIEAKRQEVIAAISMLPDRKAILAAQQQAEARAISLLPDKPIIPLRDNKWVLTTTLGSDAADLQYGSPTVVLTAVGSDPPFKSSVSYDNDRPTPDWLTKEVPVTKPSQSALDLTPGSQAYMCTPGGLNRTISIRVEGTRCEAISTRSDGTWELIGKASNTPSLCTERVKKYLKQDLVAKGVICKPK